MYKQAGLLYGHDLHHIDHIATLCCFLNIPLFVTEEIPAEYYPNLQVEKLKSTDFAEAILRKSDVLFTCLPKQLIDPLFFFDEMKLRKKLLTFWLPHGNSDKDNLGALTEEKLLLVYGKQMVDRLPKTHARHVLMGNLRAHFFKQHEKFYQAKVPKFKKNQKTLFYAPTWGEGVERTLGNFLDSLPAEYNLFVKLHPNTLAKGFTPFQDTENIRFLTDIPTIYPILAQSDVYIGDHSSIAYDFLYFNRPLFFFTDRRTPIHLSGTVTSPDTLFDVLEAPDHFHQARKDLYRYAFAEVDYNALGDTIGQTIDDYFENEIHEL